MAEQNRERIAEIVYLRAVGRMRISGEYAARRTSTRNRLTQFRRNCEIFKFPQFQPFNLKRFNMVEAGVEDDGFIRHGGAPQIDACNAAQCRRFIECIFCAGVRQVDLVLEKVDVQHDAETYRVMFLASLRIMRSNQGFNS